MKWVLPMGALLLAIAGIALIAAGVKLVGFILLVIAGLSVAGTVGGRAAAGSDLGNDS
jgi:hypothetical protein